MKKTRYTEEQIAFALKQAETGHQKKVLRPAQKREAVTWLLEAYRIGFSDKGKWTDGRVVCSSSKVSICFLSMRKCCIEYPIEILRLARS